MINLDWITNFVFYYPVFMSSFWITGSIIYYFRWERPYKNGQDLHDIKKWPGVSIVIPCFNEQDNIRETILSLRSIEYEEFEIIAVDDCSSDNTASILLQLAMDYPEVRAIKVLQNKGKANALNTAALAAKYDYLVSVDGDTILQEDAVKQLIKHFIQFPRVGAVTGNPRIRTRSTLLGRIQVGEFSGIVGLIKRAQRVYGKVFTVSGAIAAFRKSALHHVNYWSTNTVTDDIDISWKLQLEHWDIHYEPKALCWILMPETIGGLIKQRARWAQGGIEAFFHYFSHIVKYPSRRFVFVMTEFLCSIVWCICMLVFLSLLLVQTILGVLVIDEDSLLVAQVLVISISLTQFAISLWLERQYEKNIFRYYIWMIWYPLLYWHINIIAICIGLPKAIVNYFRKSATWVSPDRGLRHE